MFLKIRNTGVFALFIMLMVVGVFATSTENICDNEGFNCECQNFYNDLHYYAIEKWAFDNGEGDYAVDETNPAYSYFDIEVTGDLHDADWTSDPKVYSVLVKAGNEHEEFDGGSSGSFDSEKEISHVTFCGYRDGGSGCIGDDCGGGSSVPEFPALSIFGAVLAVTLGLVFIRKH